jgi:hypothetical protein
MYNKGLRKVIHLIAAWLGLLSCLPNASATDNVQNGHFSVPGSWPQVAPTWDPAQTFPSDTTSDTTNPINWLNPASTAGAGYAPYPQSPLSFAGSQAFGGSNYIGGIPYGGSFGSPLGGIPYVGSFGASSGIPYAGSFGSALRIPYVGSFASPLSRIPYVGSLGLPFLGGSPFSRGWSGGGWGGGIPSIGGWSPNYSSIYGGYGAYGSGFGFGGIGNPASYMAGYGNSGAHQGTVPNRIIQTGPSPASGNYYQPSTANPTASGGYYASDTPVVTPVAQPKSQPKSYWGSSSSDNWGASGNPFPKDLNSVPWAK